MPENLATVYGPEETKLRVALIDESYDGAQAARAEAVRRRTERLNEGGKFSHFVKGIWDNVAGDYYQLRDTRAAQKQIEEADDVNLFAMESREKSDRSRLATVNRFTSDYEETIHVEAGESREIQAPGTELATEIKELIRESVKGDRSDAWMAEERTRILNVYYETHGAEAIGEGKVTVDNLLAIRDATLGAIENGESLDRVLANMTVSMGEARSGVRTEANYTMVDKVIERVNNTTVGSLMGPEVVATAATVAASLLRFGSRKVVGAALLTVTPGAAAGLWAGLRENKRVKDERVQHSRDMAEGKEFEPGSKRREGMETTRYETVSSIELADNLQNLFGEGADLDDNETFRSALDTLAATQARIRMSDQRNIDLISYPEGDVEEQRLALDIALAQAKTIASHRMDAETIQALGLPRHFEFNDLLNHQAAEFIESLEQDISDKDAAFKRLKIRRVATAAATGVIVGLTIGAVAQEGIAAFSDSRQGLVEQLWNAHNKPFEGMQHQTLLNGLFHGEGGQDVVTHHAAEATSHDFVLGANHADYSVSADHNLVDNGNGTLNLVDPTGHATVENLPINPDGSLPQASLDVLHNNGMTVVDTSHNIDVASTQTNNVSVDQYVANHQDQITHVSRDGWYDNNTPAVYDRNELGLHWGGDAGSNSNGGYSMSVATMTHDGSFSGDHAANWTEQAQNGNLQLAVSASGNTQAEVFMVNIGPDGKIDIPAGSPAAQFFSSENGHTTFNGAYAEVVQKTGIDANGVEHMRPLATLVGHDNVGSLSDTVETHVAQLKPEYQITTNGYDTTEHFNSFTEMAPVIPVIPRRGMESMSARKQSGNYYEYYYGYKMTPEQLRKFKEEECSPRLNRDPAGILNPKQELNWYRKQLEDEKKVGAGYIENIDGYISNSPELNNLDANTEAIVTIPVNAAGESKNIYRTLSLYGRQEGDVLKKTLVLLHVNQFDHYFDKDSDNNILRDADGNKVEITDQVKTEIDATWAEIERAKKDFPELSIATMNTVWERAVEDRRGYGDHVIGHVARRMYDTAMMSVQHAIAEGRMPAGHDVLLIRNDADAHGIQRHYVDHMIQSFQKNPDKDVFTGAIHWGTEQWKDLPGFAFVSRFREIMHIASKRSNEWPPTVGINTAVRISTFAAVGGVGHNPERTGAGTDDYTIGGRIKDGRQVLRSRGLRKVFASLQSSNDGRVKNKRYYGEGYDRRSMNEDYSYHQVVAGADIDTDPDRLVKPYLNRVPVTDAWSNWATTTREQGMPARRIEDLRGNPDEVISQIEDDMSASISKRFGNRAQVLSVLAIMIPSDENNRPRYTIRALQNGAQEFKFTKKGALWFTQTNILDSIGSRTRRNRYHEATGFRQPNTTVAPMLQ